MGGDSSSEGAAALADVKMGRSPLVRRGGRRETRDEVGVPNHTRMLLFLDHEMS
jgi:hypothetical protein